MANDFVNVTREGWGSRIKGAFAGILFGILLSLASVVGLFWNEGRAVERYQALAEGEKIVVAISGDTVDSANEGKLVHLSGRTEVTEPLRDAEFGVTATALKLIRRVEMFQWVESKRTESKKNAGGSKTTTTTYSYRQDWSTSVERFENSSAPADYKNPGSFPVSGTVKVAGDVMIGAFRLPEFLVNQIKGSSPLPVQSLDGASEAMRTRAKLNAGGVYLGENPASPAIGDVRIQFEQVLPTDISLVAQQAGKTFAEYTTKSGGELALLETGTMDAKAMFLSAVSANKMLTWIIRGAGFLVMALGIGLILRPLSVLADVLPILGNIVGAGTGFIAFIVAGIGSTIIIAIAWVFYRPIIGISILVVTAALLFLLFRKLKSAKAPPPLEAPPPLG